MPFDPARIGRPVAAPAQPLVLPQAFPSVMGGLLGISAPMLREHVALYDRYCAALATVEAARARPALGSPLPWADAAVMQHLLGSRVRELVAPVSAPAPTSKMGGVLATLRRELQAKGIAWEPLFYFGDDDFWTADQAISINIPWFLADDTLWALVNDQQDRLTEADVLAILRHETGHALGYAFELWRLPEWKRSFGDFFQPYSDTFTIDPASLDFVRHLHDQPAAANAHYAQKHPDEDWAETFAVWLDPGSRWRETYAGWPGALAKLEAVEMMLVGKGLAYGPPPNTRVGQRVSPSSIDYTVGEYLGQAAVGTMDTHAAAIRAQPELYNAVVLHELYFGGLVYGGAGAPTLPPLADTSGYAAWQADLRACARAALAAGWVLVVWDSRRLAVRNIVVTGHGQGVPPDCTVLLALDLFEHAYAGDLGTRTDLYVAAWYRNIDWGVVEGRRAWATRPIITVVHNPVVVAPAP